MTEGEIRKTGLHEDYFYPTAVRVCQSKPLMMEV